MHGFSFIYSPFAPALLALFLPIILIALLWTLVLKGCALWYASRSGQKGWFIALLVINTFGILELVYLIWYRPGAQGANEREPVKTSTTVLK